MSNRPFANSREIISAKLMLVQEEDGTTTALYWLKLAPGKSTLRRQGQDCLSSNARFHRLSPIPHGVSSCLGNTDAPALCHWRVTRVMRMAFFLEISTTCNTQCRHCVQQ